MIKKHIIPLVICGGFGTRLWPLSRKMIPKPFINNGQNNNFFSETLSRLRNTKNIFKVKNKPLIIVVTNKEHYFLAKDNFDQEKYEVFFFLEPLSKNTTAAIISSSLGIKIFLKSKYHIENDIDLLVCPADHVIPDIEYFKKTISDAYNFSKDHIGHIVFGIVPRKPDINYGYIKVASNFLKSNIFNVKQFVEKPTQEVAKKFIKSKYMFWNSGIFFFNLEFLLNDFKLHNKKIFNSIEKLFSNNDSNVINDYFLFDEKIFSKIHDISIDYSLMEKSEKIFLIRFDSEWNDIGNINQYKTLFPVDEQHNYFLSNKNLYLDECNNTFIHSADRFIACIGLENINIIDNDDSLLIMNSKLDSTYVKNLTNYLKKNSRNDLLNNSKFHKRPWGTFQNLAFGQNFKIKIITVNPGCSLSLQSHKFRSEHWVVIQGEALVVNNNDTFVIKSNESTFIPKKSKHRLSNPSNKNILKLVEIQTGTYLEEDDIKRYIDNYGRS